MSKVTFSSKIPVSLTDFCEAMAKYFSKIERALYQDLMAKKPRAALKREYQLQYGINSRQFQSIYDSKKGKVRSSLECFQLQINQLEDRIKSLQKSIKSLKKILKQYRLKKGKGKKYDCCSIKYKTGRTIRQDTLFKLHHKQRKLEQLSAKIKRLKSSNPSIIFGGKKLWKAQFNLEASGYSSHDEWLADWRSSRESQFMLVGAKAEPAGCRICQLSTSGQIAIQVPPILKNRFGEVVKASGIQFNYGHSVINYALEPAVYYMGQKKIQKVVGARQAMTYRFAKKKGKWYIFVTTNNYEIPYQTDKENGALGVDLNPGKIGWSYCDGSGNLKAKKQIVTDIYSKNSNQTKWILGNACKQLVSLALTYQCPMVIEKLDFSHKKASLKEKGKKYARMLSNFAYSLFNQMLSSRCSRYGVELISVNPAYSSIIGLVKFMSMYGMSSDTAAGLVLARRALRLSERVPADDAFGLPEDRPRHSWHYWNRLKKKLGLLKRHDFFNFRRGNTSPVVTPSGESLMGSHLTLLRSGRTSQSRTVDSTAWSTSSRSALTI